MTWSICRPKISPEASLGYKELPLVRLHGGYLSPRLVEIIPSKPLQNNALVIKIICKIGVFGGAPLLWDLGRGTASSDDYMPLAVRIEGQSQESNVYLNVNSAASQLLVSKEEILGAQNKPGYWGDRIVTVHACIDVIRTEAKGFSSAEDVHRKMLTIHSLALEAFQRRDVPKAVACKIQGATVLQNREGRLEILYPLGELGEGTFGFVDKTISFANAKLSALKSYHFDRAVRVTNRVAESVMGYQTSHSSSDSSLMAVNRIIERDDGCFDEEYELCSSSLAEGYMRYSGAQLKDLCKCIVSAIQEFRQIGYAYLDLKPSNVFKILNAEGKEVFKLGDFDAASPYIKDVTGFKKWLAGSRCHIVHTRSMNTQDDMDCLCFLRSLGLEVLNIQQEEGVDGFEEAIVDLVVFLRQKKISDRLGRRAIEEMIYPLERLELEDFYGSLLSIFAKKAEQVVVFQLGMMFYLGLERRIPYRSICDREKYLQFDPETYAAIQDRITLSKKVNDVECRNLIIRMLNPNSDLRPSLAEISEMGFFAV